MSHWLKKSRRIEIMTPSESELRSMSRTQLIEYKQEAIRQRNRWADHLRQALEISPQLKNLDPDETDPLAFTRIQINGWNSTLEWIDDVLTLKS
ncbi:hypothetical protein ACGYLI_16985 [Sulfitobacter sp. 1A13421]|uniref:hypothetical protein n=1 Tax=Sulfitobacter sp. 1A13421 TaxID=3368595 RepID=UPI00374636B9